MAHDPRFPLSEDASGLLYSLGRQPLSHLINIPSSSVTAGTTVEGLLLSNQTIGSPSFVDECTRHHDDVAASLFCQAVINASDAVSLACKRGALLSTGMPLLDEQLGGGLQTGEICEVVGHSCSGKSQLCMAVCAHQLAATDFHVLYIDTSLSFTAERMLQLLRATLAASTSTRDAELKETMKKRLHERLRVCTGAQDLLGLLGTVGALCGEMANEADPSNWYRRLKLVVIDSAFAALAAESDGLSHSVAAAQVARLQLLLRQLVARWQVAVLVTNVCAGSAASASASSGAALRPALGYAWQHTAHVRVAMLPLSGWRCETGAGHEYDEQAVGQRDELSRLCVHRRSHAARHSAGQSDGCPTPRLVLVACHATQTLRVLPQAAGAATYKKRSAEADPTTT